jgi:hypothetical protein
MVAFKPFPKIKLEDKVLCVRFKMSIMHCLSTVGTQRGFEQYTRLFWNNYFHDSVLKMLTVTVK